MMNGFIKRLREPSTYAGLAAVVAGAGMVGKINEAETVATVINVNGPAIGSMLAGFLAMFLSEQGNK